MNIAYTYEVTHSDERGMVLRFTSPGREPVDVGARLPYEGETLEAVASMCVPTLQWMEQELAKVQPPVGATGGYEPPPPPPPLTFEQEKAKKLADLAAWRYTREVGGIVIGGARIKTDRESQATITGAFISLSQGLATSIDWKADGGVWVQLTLEQITPIAQAVVAHVQACFTAERMLAQMIEQAATIEELQAIHFPGIIR